MRKILNLILVLCMVLGLFHTVQVSASEKKKITISFEDGKKVKLPVSTIKKKEYIELEQAYTSINVRITQRSIYLTNIFTDDVVVAIDTKNNKFLVNGERIKLDYSLYIDMNTFKTYIPVHAVKYTLPLLYDSIGITNEDNNKKVDYFEKEILESVKKISYDKQIISNVSILENGLPSAAYKRDIKILHEKTMNYWDWSSFDKEYINIIETNNSTKVKQDIIKEIYLINEYRLLWEKQFVVVNGFEFYPSNVIGVLDVLDRAIESRLRLIENEPINYPETGYSSRFDGYGKISEIDMTDENIREFIYNDLKILSVLKDIPFDISMFNGYRVINVPFNIQSITYSCDVGGLVHPNVPEIVLVGSMQDLEDTFYHELGHIWSHHYMDNTTMMEYTKIRGKDFIDSGSWEDLSVENFAEDFKYIKMPYRKNISRKGSYGTPSEKEIKELISFINDLEKSNQLSKVVKINGLNLFGNIQVLKDGVLSIEGYAENSFTITIYNKDNIISEELVTVDKNKYYKKTLNFNNNGFYSIVGFGSDIIDVFLFNGIEIKPLNLDFELNKTFYWNEISIDQIDDTNISLWVDNNKFLGGYWLKDGLDDNYLLITNGSKGNKIKLDNVSYDGKKISINVSSGNQNEILLTLPRFTSNVPIVVNGLSIPFETKNKAELIYGSITTKYEDSGLYTVFKVKSPTGYAYVEVWNNDNIMSSELMSLSTYSENNWSSITVLDRVNILENTNKDITVYIYDSTSKSNLLGKFK